MAIRTAILGYGRSGSTMHAGPIEKLDDYEMTAVCDIDTERQAQAKERFDCPIYDDYHKMLASEALDLVVVVTRSDQHCQMTCDCLDAGVNVLVTKPWAVNAEEARRMMAAAQSSGKLLMPWLPARWGADVERLRQLLCEEKVIGRVFLIRRAVTSFGTRCDWQTEKKYGGGYLLNWGPHIVDPPMLLKAVPPVSVYGRMMQTINPGDTEDVFLAVITLADGTVVQAEYTVSVEPLPEWYIQGDRGTIVVTNEEIRIHPKTPARPDDPTRFSTMEAGNDGGTTEKRGKSSYGDQFRIYAEIAQAIRGDRPYAVPPEDALQLSKTFDAIRLSNETNQVVTL